MDARHGTDETRLVEDMRAARRQGLPRIAHRLHDVIDMGSGRIETAPVVRSLTAAARVKRLGRLGFLLDSAVFGAPTHRITPRTPYQASPEAWLDAYEGTYSTGPGNEQIWWRLPSQFATEFTAACNVTFRGVPAGPRVTSLVVEAWPYAGRTGEIVIDIGADRTQIPVSAAVSRTIDIGFVHDGADPMDVRVLLREGLIDFVVHSITMGGGPIVLQPAAMAGGVA